MHHHRHHHLPFLPHSDPTAADFDSIFAGVSLQSLLLGEPVLLTPPPSPFPPPSPPTTATPITAAPQFCDRGFQPPQPAPTFFFQAADAASFEKQRRQTRGSHAPTGAPPPPHRQRQKVSEKLKALRKIVPCDQKADIATMLEQAYRYVRYLEAQVLALLTMQLCTRDEGHVSCLGGGSGGGNSEIERRMIESVGRLSRKEVVEAVVNSGTAQRVMYEEGLCLVSEEQVRVLAWATFQKQQQQELSGLIGAANPGNNNNNPNDDDDNNNTSSSSSCYSYSCYSYN